MSATSKVRIFLLGHGSLIPGLEIPEIPDIYFYVEEGVMLSTHFIPSIFQSLENPPSFTLEQLKEMVPSAKELVKEKGTKWEYALFSYEGQNMLLTPSIYSEVKVLPIVNWVGNKAFCNAKQYDLTSSFPRFVFLSTVEIDGEEVCVYTGTGDFTDDILIVPQVNKDLEINHVVRLSKIDEWVRGQPDYQNVEVEYHWLACRDMNPVVAEKVHAKCES